MPDVEEEIVAAVNALRARYTYVFTTGGIGPTHDDITADCVAKAFGVGDRASTSARVAMLRERYADPADLNEARLRMARIPHGADLDRQPDLEGARASASATSSSWPACRRSCRRCSTRVAPTLQDRRDACCRSRSTRRGLPEGAIRHGRCGAVAEGASRRRRSAPIRPSTASGFTQPDRRARRATPERLRRRRAPPSRRCSSSSVAKRRRAPTPA